MSIYFAYQIRSGKVLNTGKTKKLIYEEKVKYREMKQNIQ